MHIYLDVPLDHEDRDGMVDILKLCGFHLAPPFVPINHVFYYAYCVGIEAKRIKDVVCPKYDLTIVTLGEFDDFLPRHISPNGPVFIDVRSGRIVSPPR